MSVEHEALTRAKEKMEKTEKVLANELVSIRAGRANPKLLEQVMVDYYGTSTPITQVGNVASPEPRLLTLTLWDASMLKAVEKAILASDLGLTPSNDGKVIRLVFPEPTAERRKELVKQAKKKAEDSKVAIRSIRRDANDAFKKDKKASAITEDDLSALEKEIQDLTDKAVKRIDKMMQEKEAEIMEI